MPLNKSWHDYNALALVLQPPSFHFVFNVSLEIGNDPLLQLLLFSHKISSVKTFKYIDGPWREAGIIVDIIVFT
jgi:hypothetical protein